MYTSHSPAGTRAADWADGRIPSAAAGTAADPDSTARETAPAAEIRSMSNALRSIMMVEDTEEDFEALTRALKKAEIHNPVYRFSHGESALDYLRGRGRYVKPGSSTRPGLVLLDLNLPGDADGRGVLNAIKSDQNLRAIPVIVLTSSASSADVEFCYRAGANSYILKPQDTTGMVDLIGRLKQYWFELVMLPDPSAQQHPVRP